MKTQSDNNSENISNFQKDNPKRNKNDRSNNKGKGSNNSKGKGSNSNQGNRDGNGGKEGKQVKRKPWNFAGWYYLDKGVAEQSSQLSFQNLAGYPIEYDNYELSVPNLVQILLNPCPGVIEQSKFGTSEAQDAGINQAGFMLYTELSATTGRVSSYGPQDVSSCILAYGEIVSDMEWLRRAFGVSKVGSERNRDYPRQLLQYGMGIDPDDFFKYRSVYREQYNEIVTLLAGFKMPKNVAYFEKCAKLYENIFLDYSSPMAQTLIPNPSSTWIYDETTYSGGAILKTVPWIDGTTHTFDHYLSIAKSCVMAVLNSSVTSKVYTDLLNYALKYSMDWWTFDYIFEDYAVGPIVDPMFSTQMHNATIAGVPVLETAYVNTASQHVTPLNDVYPDPNNNTLYYNPAFSTVRGVPNGICNTGNTVIVDVMTPNLDLDTRVDMTRYMSVSTGTAYTPTGLTDPVAYVDTVLPDHYVTAVIFFTTPANGSGMTKWDLISTIVDDTYFADYATLLANIDWAPRIIGFNVTAQTYTGHHTGDVNFYTTVDRAWLKKLHKLMTLGLFAVRKTPIKW